MFDFLVLGYIQDQHTGASFSVPVSEKWEIFIEVCYNSSYYSYLIILIDSINFKCAR